MSTPQADTPNPEENSLPLDHSHILLTSFNSFLTVAIHNILYYRSIYPPSTFLSTKAYNLPVHQNRHPKVCAWIRDAVDAVAVQLSTGHVSRIAIVIHSPLDAALPPPSPSSQPQQSQSTTSFTSTPSHPQQPVPPPPPPPPPPGSVLERWLISTTHFPRWPTPTSTNHPSKSQAAFSRILARDSRSEEARERHLAPDPLNPSFSWPDLDEQLRGALRRMASTAEGMGALPVVGCGFTVAVELEEAGRAPLGHPQAWIPSEPNLQPQGKGKEVAGNDIGGVKTRPIRAVEAGPLFFECWVEEGKAKAVLAELAERDVGGSQGSTQPF